MKFRIYFFGVLLIIIIVYIGSCRKAGHWLMKEDEPVPADAIVILMGSVYDRVLQASDLYQQGLSRKMLMVETIKTDDDKVLQGEAVYNRSNTGQTRNLAISLGVPPDSIKILPGGATSTQMEAIIIRSYLANHPGIDTILLVSSAEHTLRASIIFKSAFRKADMKVHVVSSPSIYSHFHAEKWWKSREGIKDVLMEYLKIGYFFFFDRFKL